MSHTLKVNYIICKFSEALVAMRNLNMDVQAEEKLMAVCKQLKLLDFTSAQRNRQYVDVNIDSISGTNCFSMLSCDLWRESHTSVESVKKFIQKMTSSKKQ